MELLSILLISHIFLRMEIALLIISLFLLSCVNCFHIFQYNIMSYHHMPIEATLRSVTVAEDPHNIPTEYRSVL